MDIMDFNKDLERFFDQREGEYTSQLMKNSNLLKVSFKELVRHNPSFADVLEFQTEDFFTMLQIRFADSFYEFRTAKIRIVDFPNCYKSNLEQIGVKQINKFVRVDAFVRRSGILLNEVIRVKISCGCKELWQPGTAKIPHTCRTCYEKYRIVDKQYTDVIRIMVEDDYDEISSNNQPRQMNIVFRGGLATYTAFEPGRKIRVNALVRSEKYGKREQEEITYLDAHSLELLQDDLESLQVTPEDKQQIKELSNDPNLISKLISLTAPHLEGLDNMKEALIIQKAGGVSPPTSTTATNRKEIHILFVGNPGKGKTDLLLDTKNTFPKSMFVSAPEVTGAGLTVAAVRDEQTGKWAADVGAVVRCNNSVLCIDEGDKCHPDDFKKLHTVMEQGIVAVSKAGIDGTFQAKTSILMSANPKYGRWDDTKTLWQQVEFGPTFLDRFDLLFVFKQTSFTERKLILDKINKLYLGKLDNMEDKDTLFLKKYYKHVRMTEPLFTPAAVKKLNEFFNDPNVFSQDNQDLDWLEKYGTRMYKSLFRLAGAYAKIRLSKKIEEKDATDAIKLLIKSLESYCWDADKKGLNLETQTIIGVKDSSIQELIVEYIEKNKKVKVEDLFKEFNKFGQDKIYNLVMHLKKIGVLAEPRPDELIVLK